MLYSTDLLFAVAVLLKIACDPCGEGLRCCLLLDLCSLQLPLPEQKNKSEILLSILWQAPSPETSKGAGTGKLSTAG